MTRNAYLFLLAGSIISIASMHAFSQDPPTPDECQDILLADIDECNRTFTLSTDDPDADHNAAQTTLESCLDGANASHIACLEGNPASVEDRNAFLSDLEECLRQYPNPEDGASLRACLLGALNTYRAKLGLDPIDVPNACASIPTGGLAVAPLEILISAAYAAGSTDGRYPVEVNTSLGFQAGVSVSGNYNLAARPCIKQAEVVAVYRTKTGYNSTTYDADIDTSDGVFFDLPIFANRLVDADEVKVLVIYYDTNGGPIFIEYGALKVLNSPITGDWNRDMVLTPQDITDFLDSYTAQTNRADLNNDGQVDGQDAAEFTGTSTE